MFQKSLLSIRISKWGAQAALRGGTPPWPLHSDGTALEHSATVAMY